MNWSTWMTNKGGYENDYDTDLDVMFCWSYGFINDSVCSMESDGKKEPG